MTYPLSPEDRPDPSEQHAVRARVPDHVARGVFSTGVIVMTAPTEFVVDFIQNLGRPHQVVARVIMAHQVMPQFVEALLKNIELYRGRYGNLPQPNMSGVMVTTTSGPVVPAPAAAPLQPKVAAEGAANVGPLGAVPPSAAGPSSGAASASAESVAGSSADGTEQPSASSASGSGFLPPDSVPPQNVRRASAQEIYDDLKLRDEILSGSYANAVMIGHGPHEFSFDFITNFYPHSAVSARVFMAAGQVARLADSLKGAWDQIRHRFPPSSGSNSPPTD